MAAFLQMQVTAVLTDAALTSHSWLKLRRNQPYRAGFLGLGRR
jgi:hypothetical protein